MTSLDFRNKKLILFTFWIFIFSGSENKGSPFTLHTIVKLNINFNLVEKKQIMATNTNKKNIDCAYCAASQRACQGETTYKCRAEISVDVIRFVEQFLRDTRGDLNNGGFFGATAVFSTHKSIEEVRKSMRRVPDLHVMI